MYLTGGYDTIESIRLTNEWVGATAKDFWSCPVFSFDINPLPAIFAAWGKVTERSFSRITAKPDWGISSVVSDCREYNVAIEVCQDLPFCNLVEFKVQGRPAHFPKVLLIAPMSGHYSTLIRQTVVSLLPECDVFVTEWKNARDIPISEGHFDIEDFCLYVAGFMRILGPEINVVAICQPAPLALAAVAMAAEDDPDTQPTTLTLIGGPVDPDANPTEVTDFGRRVLMDQLEFLTIQSVGIGHAGVGREVFPGSYQLASFMAMNPSIHLNAFKGAIMRTALGEDSDLDRHNQFYDEYLSVMDLTKEFYLSTIVRLFKGCEIAKNCFSVKGRPVDLGKITRTAVKVVEGGKDDISAPGQCLAALDLLTGLPDNKKAAWLEPNAGHYGIFSGKAWQMNIRPKFLEFIQSYS